MRLDRMYDRLVIDKLSLLEIQIDVISRYLLQSEPPYSRVCPMALK